MKVSVRETGQRSPKMEHKMKPGEEIIIEWPGGQKIVLSATHNPADGLLDVRSSGHMAQQIVVGSVAGNRIELGLR